MATADVQPQQQPQQQPDPDTVKFTEFDGLRNDTNTERFLPTDLATANNIDIDKSGQLSRRPGYTQQTAGAYHSLWSDNSQCFAVSGSSLVRLSSAYAATPIKTLVDSLARMSYAAINGRVYMSNGADIALVEGGILRTWGITIPPLPGVSIGVGNLLQGTYQFCMTYSRADGQESGAPLAGIVSVVAGAGLNFVLPVSTDAGVVLKTLYLSTPNGEVMYQALQVANKVTGASYIGDTQEFTLPLLTQFKTSPPAGQLVGYYRGCMFIAVGDVLYPSEPFAYELFDLRKGIQFDGRITMFAAMEDKERQGESEGMGSGLFLGTDRSCGVLVGKEPVDFQYVPKVDYGAIEGALTYVDGSLYGDNSIGARLLPMWLTAQGVCVGMPQMEINNLTRTRYGFTVPTTGKGAAVFIPGPNKVILTTNY